MRNSTERGIRPGDARRALTSVNSGMHYTDGERVGIVRRARNIWRSRSMEPGQIYSRKFGATMFTAGAAVATMLTLGGPWVAARIVDAMNDTCVPTGRTGTVTPEQPTVEDLVRADLGSSDALQSDVSCTIDGNDIDDPGHLINGQRAVIFEAK